VIPDSVTRIVHCAFYGCSSLTSVMIPDSVTYIGYGAFAGCSSLISIVIPDSVTYIGPGTVCGGCVQLQQVIAPAQYHSLFPGVTSLLVPSQYLFK